LKFFSPQGIYFNLFEQTSTEKVIINYTATIPNFGKVDPVITNSVFPDKDILEAYSYYNLGLRSKKVVEWALTPERGGYQGYYANLIEDKIDNVVECLDLFPNSKRAVISFPNYEIIDHKMTPSQKCMREVYFNTVNNRLNVAVTMRAQAVEIFPKNFHFVYTLAEYIQQKLKVRYELGTYFLYCAQVFKDRNV